MSSIRKIQNETKKKFSNAKNFYYVLENIKSSDGSLVNLLFTKRELLVAKDKYSKFFKS